MAWTSAPHYVAEIQPAREDPKQVYMAYRRLLTQNTKEVNADGLATMVRRYGESLDPIDYMNFRDYVFRLAQHVEKRKSDPHYTRLVGLIDASRIMRADHQAEFHRLLFGMQHVEELKHPFCKSVAKSVERFKQNMLNKPHVPFGALGMSQKHEVEHVLHRKIPEARYAMRRRNQTRPSQRGRPDQRRSDRPRPYNDHRDRDRDRNRTFRDQNRDYSASRGSNGRGRRASRGNRQRGQGRQNNQNHQKENQQRTEDVSNNKPSKQAVWNHPDRDREAIIEAFEIQES